ncbi:MAG: hypothetical protein C0472_04405 [Erythrobacter sp.]|nr:hypothetical protein [Erythrobacter sp.]
MASGRKGKAGQRKGRGGGGRSASRQRPAKLPLAAHRAFAPLLGVWGALLGAGVVVVLPEPMVAQMLRGTLIGTWAAAAQPALAWIAGGLLGVLLFAFAAWRHVRARRGKRGPSIAAMAARRVTPINPARDLGSLRLDDPVETMPFSTPAWRDADAGDAQRAAVPEPASAPAAEPAPAPRELDLADFAELPGRNAVWVEEAAPAVAEPAPAPAPSAAAPAAHPHRSTSAPLPVPGSAALARLRAVPASQLSLAEMVERFAGALHEVRETSPGRSLGPGDLAAREAALAEALKALEALSGTNRPAPRLPRRDEPLPAARARLQPHLERVRGAA